MVILNGILIVLAMCGIVLLFVVVRRRNVTKVRSANALGDKFGDDTANRAQDIALEVV